MVRITFRAADGSLQTTTVSWLHIMHLITDPQPKHEAATLRECKCDSLYARHVQCLHVRQEGAHSLLYAADFS
jgi:hypothetical protein